MQCARAVCKASTALGFTGRCFLQVSIDNRFGYGDVVRLKNPSQPESLMYGAARNWKTTGVGKVMMGGRRFKGDCLVDINGQRLWVGPDEIEMILENPDPCVSFQPTVCLKCVCGCEIDSL